MNTTRRPVTFADMDRVARERPPIDDRVVQQLGVNEIAGNPKNPRSNLGDLTELAASLETHGLLQPILVRHVYREGVDSVEGRTTEGLPYAHYEVIAGHRRLEAARILDWRTIACVVRDAEPDEAFVLTLVENLQRDDLSAREEAAGLEVLLREHRWNTVQVAEAVKRSHAFVSKRLRVFDDPILAPYVLTNRVSVSVAEETLTLGPEDRRAVIERAASGALAGKADVRRAVVEILAPARTPHLPRGFDAALDLVLQGITEAQLGELTDKHVRKLRKIFDQAADYNKRFERRQRARERGRVLPQIGASGRVDLPVEEPEFRAFEGPYRVVPHRAEGDWYVLDSTDREVAIFKSEQEAIERADALNGADSLTTQDDVAMSTSGGGVLVLHAGRVTERNDADEPDAN